MSKRSVLLLSTMAVGLLLFSCTSAGTYACRTSFDTCRSEQPGKVGYTCVCKYEYHVNTGVFVENL